MSNFGYPPAVFNYIVEGDRLCVECTKQENPECVADYWDKGKKSFHGGNIVAESMDMAEVRGMPIYCDSCHKILPVMVVCVKNSPIDLECLDLTKCQCEDCEPELYIEPERSEY